MPLRLAAFCCVMALASALAGCTGSEEEKQLHLRNGNRYFEQKKYHKAIIEYANAIQIDDKFGEARYRLAESYAVLGNTQGAYGQYIRAADLLPDVPEVQIKTGTLLLMNGRFEDARSKARHVLERDPNNVAAQILLGNALAGLGDLDGAVSQIEEAMRLEPAAAAPYSNLAIVRLAQGQQDEARKAFEKAVELEPASVHAWLALAHFQWAVGEVDPAEKSLLRAFALDPKNALTNRALATLYLSSGRAPQAEHYLSAIVGTSRSPLAQFMLADYYSLVNRAADARRILAPLVRDKGTFAEAQARLAQLEYDAGRLDAANSALEEVLRQEPSNARALRMKARWLAVEGKRGKAIERATAAVNANPRSIAGLYLLGLLQAGAAQFDKATKSFNEVLRLNPRATAAQIQLSSLALAQGDPTTAVQFAEQALRGAPDDLSARVGLARALLGQHDTERAATAIKTLVKEYPAASVVYELDGALRVQKSDLSGARSAFARALQLNPRSADALFGLTEIDVREKNLIAARNRLEAGLVANPDDPALLLLAGRVHLALTEYAKAERVLRLAIGIDPANPDPYMLLGQIYETQQKLEAARAEFDDLARRNDKDMSARTMSAMIVHAQGNVEGAKKRYAEILAADSGSPVAANNLAWIYAEEGANLDAAVQLAKQAVEALPENAELHDTLGWIYYRKQLPRSAIGPFEAAIARDPENPTFRYHVGLAYAETGDVVRARDAFEMALKLRPDFADAKRELALAAGGRRQAVGR